MLDVGSTREARCLLYAKELSPIRSTSGVVRRVPCAAVLRHTAATSLLYGRTERIAILPMIESAHPSVCRLRYARLVRVG